MSSHIKFVLLATLFAGSSALIYFFSSEKESSIAVDLGSSITSDNVPAQEEILTAVEKKSPTENKEDVARSVSLLSAYPGFGHQIDKDEDIFSQEEMMREKLISKCMAANGFEYTPAPSVVIDEAAAGSPEEFDRLLMEASIDPNDAYVQSLSAEMRDAYYFSLAGIENPNDPEAQAHIPELHRESCVGQAFEAVPGVYAKRNALSDAYDRMELEVAEDPRITASIEAWSECMKENGLAYARPQDVHRSADRAAADLIEAGDAPDATEFALDEINKALKTLKDCDKKTALSEKQRAVRIEYENRFVKQNLAQLKD